MGTALAQPNITGFVIGQRVRYNDQAPCRLSSDLGFVLGYDWRPPLKIGGKNFDAQLLVRVMWDCDPDPKHVHPCWLEPSG